MVTPAPLEDAFAFVTAEEFDLLAVEAYRTAVLLDAQCRALYLAPEIAP